MPFHKPLAQLQQDLGSHRGWGCSQPGRSLGRVQTTAAALVGGHSQGLKGHGLEALCLQCTHQCTLCQRDAVAVCWDVGAVTLNTPGAAGCAAGDWTHQAWLEGCPTSAPSAPLPNSPTASDGVDLSSPCPQHSSDHNEARRRHLKLALQVPSLQKGEPSRGT